MDVLTAFEDGSHGLDDPPLLDRAGALGRVLFTNDDDLLREAVRCQRSGERFQRLIYVHQDRLTIGETIEELELVAVRPCIDPKRSRQVPILLPW